MAEVPSMGIIKRYLQPCSGCNASSATSRKEVLYSCRRVVLKPLFSGLVLKPNRRTAVSLSIIGQYMEASLSSFVDGKLHG